MESARPHPPTERSVAAWSPAGIRRREDEGIADAAYQYHWHLDRIFSLYSTNAIGKFPSLQMKLFRLGIKLMSLAEAAVPVPRGDGTLVGVGTQAANYSAKMNLFSSMSGTRSGGVCAVDERVLNETEKRGENFQIATTGSCPSVRLRATRPTERLESDQLYSQPKTRKYPEYPKDPEIPIARPSMSVRADSSVFSEREQTGASAHPAGGQALDQRANSISIP